MLTFIPSWSTPSYNGLSNDDLIGQIQAYHESGKAYQVIIQEDIPSLRYFLHHYNLLECNYWSVFDYLQESRTFEQRKVILEELNFPEAVSFHYMGNGILVRLHEHLVGRLYFGAGSHIKEVHYFENEQINSIAYYDDRGFISRRQTYREGKPESLLYLDVKGEWIFKVEETGRCYVNPENSKGLKFSSYESIENIESECVEYFLGGKSPSSLLVAVDPRNISWIEKSALKSQMTLSLFKERYPYSAANIERLSHLSSQVHGFIVDEEQKFKQIYQEMGTITSVALLSPYDTRFTLSKSQEYPKEVISIDLRQTSENKSKSLLHILIPYCVDCFIHKGRVLKLVFRVRDGQHINKFEKQLDSFLREFYGEILDEIDNFEKMEEKGKDLTGELLKKELSEEVQWLKAFQEDLEIKVIYNDDEFFQLMSISRLIIDLGTVPDLFTQIAGLSAGIPQINEAESVYIEDQKNGWISHSLNDLKAALVYFLDELKHWQEARVYSVQQIRQHSGVQLQRKLSKIVGDETSGK